MTDPERFPQPPKVSPKAAAAYRREADAMVLDLNRTLADLPGITDLVGGDLAMMGQNHLHHARFMANFFRFSDEALLWATVAWVYRSYGAHGFSMAYFPLELEAWIAVVENRLPSEEAAEIVAVYRWLIDHHEAFLEEALRTRQADRELSVPPASMERCRLFLEALLEGDAAEANRLASQAVADTADLAEFYLHVITPAMTEVGNRWEEGALSVAREHLATAIVSRVMSNQYLRFSGTERTKGRALVSAAANEFHELGARMVADMLEMSGWDVLYLGSNIPVDVVLQTIREEKPFLVCFSVTMPFNLLEVGHIIGKLRADPETASIRILVGGRSLQLFPQLLDSLGADEAPKDALEALKAAESLWESA